MAVRTVYIYALVDPTDNVERYVGQAVNPETRFSQHISVALKSQDFHPRHYWIKKLNAAGKRPYLVILEEADQESAKEREIYWISKLKAVNDLTNVSHNRSYSFESDTMKRWPELYERSMQKRRAQWGLR